MIESELPPGRNQRQHQRSAIEGAPQDASRTLGKFRFREEDVWGGNREVASQPASVRFLPH